MLVPFCEAAAAARRYFRIHNVWQLCCSAGRACPAARDWLRRKTRAIVSSTEATARPAAQAAWLSSGAPFHRCASTTTGFTPSANWPP